MWLLRTSGFVRYPLSPRRSCEALQEDEWKAEVINLSSPAVNSPESASEKVPAPVIEVTCSPHAWLGLHKTGRKLPSCVFCRTQWFMIIQKAKSVSFIGPLGGRLLFRE